METGVPWTPKCLGDIPSNLLSSVFKTELTGGGVIVLVVKGTGTAVTTGLGGGTGFDEVMLLKNTFQKHYLYNINFN